MGQHDAEIDFVRDLASLLSTQPRPADQSAAILRATADVIDSSGVAPSVHIVAFTPGRRSTDESSHPGLGSSDCAAVMTGGDADTNRSCVLFDLQPLADAVEVDATIRFGDAPGEPLPGWDRRPVDTAPGGGSGRRTVAIHPERDLRAEDVGFAHGFLRSAVVGVRATRDGVPVAADTTTIDMCDIRNLGSLYQRVIDRIVVPDTARQAAAAGVADPGPAFHPWFPVLTIGGDKAALYTHALVADIVAKERHLSDPAWLLRVGVHLELLTCLGIFEAVRDDIGDLLSPDERAAFESAPAFAQVRARLDVEAWRRIWDMRKVAFPRLGVPRAGPVSSLNLIVKKRATLAFLHVHHDDLKHAIELAGPNHHNAQETWQRVFRDAERAVLRKTAEAFPELAFLPAPMREVVLWQEQGIAGQQGLYPTACTQYRDSMNAVADWAKARGLMDHTGSECVPASASLIDARLHDPARVAVLQRVDGYDEDGLDVVRSAPLGTSGDGALTAEFEALLAEVPILQMLSPEELRDLATLARPLLVMPDERIVVQGTAGDSLFVIADGTLEVILRRRGTDTFVETMGRGAVFGEMALLTGERRTATVRAVDSALLFEIGRLQYEPILQRHPEWLDDLAMLMEERLRRRNIRFATLDRSEADVSIRDRIRQRFFAPRTGVVGFT